MPVSRCGPSTRPPGWAGGSWGGGWSSRRRPRRRAFVGLVAVAERVSFYVRYGFRACLAPVGMFQMSRLAGDE